MAVLDGIQVRVLVDDAVAKEYDHPSNPSSPNHARRCIRAEPGQTLAIEVSVLPGYGLHDASFLVAKVQTDGFGHPLIRKCSVERVQQDEEGVVSVGGRVALFEKRKVKDERSGQWYLCQYCFADLEETHGPASAPTLTEEEVENLGTIRINFFRAYRVAMTPKPRRGDAPRELDSISSEQMQGRNLSSTIQLDVEDEISEPHVKQFRYLPLPGVLGEKSYFTYYYRSKRPLQFMGAMPRDPPLPNPFVGPSAAAFSSVKDMIRRKEQRVSDLNQKLLEQDDNYETMSPEKLVPEGGAAQAFEQNYKTPCPGAKVKKDKKTGADAQAGTGEKDDAAASSGSESE